jgi:hypothetical protein
MKTMYEKSKTVKSLRELFTSAVALLALCFFSQSVQAGSGLVAEKNALLAKNLYKYMNKKVVNGGDFSLDLAASAPLSYVHSVGGGAWDDKTIGRNADVVESLEGGDFKCGDRVTYLTQITVGATAVGSQTIAINYAFLAAATGQPGVALGDIIDASVQINRGTVVGGDGPGGVDAAMHDDGGSTATLSGESITGKPEFQKGAVLVGTVTVTDLEAGEVVIVRMDVRIDCDGRQPTGNLGASLTGAAVTAGGGSGKQTISAGGQTVPFKNVDAIQQGTCALDKDLDKVCEGDINTYTVTTNGTPTWTLTGDAQYVDANGFPLNPQDPGSAKVVNIKAIAPTGLKGSYTLHVHINTNVTPIDCEDVVDVYRNAPKPIVIVHNGVAPLCGTSTLPSLEVCSPVIGITYYLEDKDGIAVANLTAAEDAANPGFALPVIFENLVAGSGFKIKASNDGNCESGYTICGEEVTECPNPGRQAAPGTKPTSSLDKASAKDLVAYPVPFSDKVTIKFTSPRNEKYVVNLYDMQGKLVKQLKEGRAKAGEEIRIELSAQHLNENMYVARKISKSGSSSVRLVKDRE